MERYVENLLKNNAKSSLFNNSVASTAKVIKDAPVLILIFKDKDDDWETSDNLSIGGCVQNMLLYAASIDLGSLWIRDTYCVAEELSKLYGGNRELSCAISLGHPNESPSKRPRRDLSDIVDLFY